MFFTRKLCVEKNNAEKLIIYKFDEHKDKAVSANLTADLTYAYRFWKELTKYVRRPLIHIRK